MKADNKTELAVRNMFDEFAEALYRGDIERIMPLFAPDPDAVHIGTAGDEWCTGVGELRSLLGGALAQFKGIMMNFGDLRISSAGPVCWLAAGVSICARANSEYRVAIGRATAVLERRGNRWYFVQSHFSLPAKGQEAGRAFPDEAPEGLVDAA